MRSLSTCPSVDGVRPRLAAEIAFSTAWTIERSQTWTLEQPRLRHADGGELIERHVAAIGLDLDMVEQRGRGASGAQAGKLLLERGDRALHAALEVVHVECRRCHGVLRE